MEINICFRSSLSGGHIDAIFIDSAPECNNNRLMSYAHMGQHSEACIDWVYNRTRPARAVEYANLKNELETLYEGYDLIVKQRLPSYSNLIGT